MPPTATLSNPDGLRQKAAVLAAAAMPVLRRLDPACGSGLPGAA
jgi:hypothetical protein